CSSSSFVPDVKADILDRPLRARRSCVTVHSEKARAPVAVRGPSRQAVCLLTRAVLDRLLDLLLHRFEVERSRSLHRRKFNRGLRQISDVLLDHDETPELTGVEVLAVAEGAGVGRLAADIRRAFERILPDVDQSRHVGRGLFARPAERLLEERELEVVEPKRTQARTAEVEDLAAFGWASSGEKLRLIVAVEMVLIGPVAELHAPEELLGDFRISRRSHQRGEPVEAGEDPVLDRAGLDPARPADD